MAFLLQPPSYSWLFFFTLLPKISIYYVDMSKDIRNGFLLFHFPFLLRSKISFHLYFRGWLSRIWFLKRIRNMMHQLMSNSNQLFHKNPHKHLFKWPIKIQWNLVKKKIIVTNLKIYLISLVWSREGKEKWSVSLKCNRWVLIISESPAHLVWRISVFFKVLRVLIWKPQNSLI